jgi:nucleoside-diphosphate-sugar epimerase
MYCAHDLPVTIIRPCLLYGPGKSSGNNILRRWALKRIHFLIDGGQAKISLCYVVDLARAIILAGTCKQAVGQCYNISDGVGYSKREILKSLEEITGRRKLLLSVPSSPVYQVFGILHKIITRLCSNASIQLDPRRVLFSAHNHVIDITKATKELNYKPRIFLREGLEKTLVWFSQLESKL